MTSSAGPASPDRGRGVGLLVFRAWIEPGARPSLRVRVTRTDDLDEGESTSFVSAQVDELEQALRDWLRKFQER